MPQPLHHSRSSSTDSLRYIDVCSGISAPTAAWKPLGWQALCYAEIEAAPRAVLAHHYPDVPLVGDFTAIKGNEYGPVDLLVGGTPCQSFSIAGLRGGLADERGNLALEYLRLADRARPRWLVWENVPGVLSTNGGRDFGAILGGMAELGYGFAYRVFDAQHFGVPQRRRRVFVVGYLGDWRRAAAVLFERHGLSGNPAPRREARQGSAGVIARSVAIRGRDGVPQAELGDELANAILTPNGGRAGVGCGAALIEPVSATVSSKWAKGSGGPSGDECQNLLPVPVASAAKDYGADAMDDCSPTLRAGGFRDSHANAGVMPAVAFTDTYNGTITGDVAATMGTRGSSETASGPTVLQRSAVRRLTPRECERLQGFPDDFTLVPYRGRMMADGPRYKMLGNSMAVPVMRWIGERIAAVDAIKIKAEAA